MENFDYDKRLTRAQAESLHRLITVSLLMRLRPAVIGDILRDLDPHSIFEFFTSASAPAPAKTPVAKRATAAPARVASPAGDDSADVARVLGYLDECAGVPCGAPELIKALEIDGKRIARALNRLMASGKVSSAGERRGKTYQVVLVNGDAGQPTV